MSEKRDTKLDHGDQSRRSVGAPAGGPGADANKTTEGYPQTDHEAEGVKVGTGPVDTSSKQGNLPTPTTHGTPGTSGTVPPQTPSSGEVGEHVDSMGIQTVGPNAAKAGKSPLKITNPVYAEKMSKTTPGVDNIVGRRTDKA